MIQISRSFLFGLLGAIVFGALVFCTMVYIFDLPLLFELDNERGFFTMLYSILGATGLVAFLGAVGGVVYSRK